MTPLKKQAQRTLFSTKRGKNNSQRKQRKQNKNKKTHQIILEMYTNAKVAFNKKDKKMASCVKTYWEEQKRVIS